MTENAHRKAVVTGASTGIGAVYARKLAARGYDLITVARNGARLEAEAGAIRETFNRSVETIVSDLSDTDEATKLAQRLAADSAITLLVNNAGVSSQGGMLKNSLVDTERLIAVNVTAPTLLSIAAAKAFAARGGGAVVNISSVTAFVPERFDGAYSGSKSFLINLTISLAGAMKDSGVRFQAVLPGPTDTAMWARGNVPESVIPRSMIMSPEELVEAALVGLDRGETITLPTVSDESVFAAYETARLALGPHLAAGRPAERYRRDVEAA
jgi:uncharacterized protein